MKSLAIIGALGAAATLGGCEEYYGPPAPAPVAAATAYGAPVSATAPACFYTRDIRNHTVADDHTLYINVSGRAVYRIEMSGACLAGATSTDPIVIRNPPGSNSVCQPIDLDIGVRAAGGFNNHCIVSSITPVTPNELAALPPRLRP